MATFHIFTAPESLQSGSDPLGKRTVKLSNEFGLSCKRDYLWPNKLSDQLARVLPVGAIQRLYKYSIGQVYFKKLLKTIQPGDVVLVDGPGIPRDLSCKVEKAITRMGAHYVYHMTDDYLALENGLYKGMAERRIPMAELILMPTETIKESVLNQFPSATCEAYQEPIDAHRLRPLPETPLASPPHFLWAGSQHSIGELDTLIEPLEELYKKRKFVLRIVSGKKRPNLQVNFPVEWHPFDLERESEFYAGSLAGLAPVKPTAFGKGKGTYKIKAYFSTGLPPIASAVGIANVMITDKENGLLVHASEDWLETLTYALDQPEHLKTMGQAGRLKVESELSHEALVPTWCRTLIKHFPQLGAEA